jgi:hypothetical protein
MGIQCKCVHSLVARIQLLFIDVSYSARHRKHRCPARKDLVAQERVTLAAPF